MGVGEAGGIAGGGVGEDVLCFQEGYSMRILDYVCSPGHQRGANDKMVQRLKDNTCWEPGRETEFWLVMEHSSQVVVAMDRKNFPSSRPGGSPLTRALVDDLKVRRRDFVFYYLGMKGDLGWYANQGPVSARWE